MTNEEKDLLLRDLCSRLPFKVMIMSVGENKILGLCDLKDVDNLPLPYLRPMSSMTEEEVIEFNNIPSTKYYRIVNGDIPWDVANHKQIDWLNANHFDYRGLIPMDLALPAPECMYNK